MTVRHLLKNAKTGRLSYRRIFPVELRSHVFGSPSEFKRSLGAKSITDSKAWAAYEAAHSEYETIAATARKKLEQRYDVLDPPKIAHLAALYEYEALAANDAMRQTGDMHRLELQDNGNEAFLDEFKGWRNTGDLSEILEFWRSKAEGLLDREGICLDPSDPDRLDALCFALNTAGIKVGEECQARLRGLGSVPTPAAPQRPSKGLTGALENPRVTASGNTFESVVRAYMDNPRLGVTTATKESINTALRYFSEVHGSPSPEAITRRMVTEWLNHIALRPSRLPKEDRNLSLVELTSKYQGQLDVPRMSPATQKKYIGALAKCWAECQSAGDITEGAPNPFRGHKMSPPAPSSSVNGMSLSEMQGIFDLPIFTAGERPKQGRGEACFWIPLILLWTGARPEEVAQLLVSDIYQEKGNGQWYLNISDEGVHPVKGKQALKTSRHGTGRRAVPLPKPLISLGLIEYRAHLVAAGHTALFPLLTLKNKKRVDLFPSFGSWWSLYVRGKGILPRGRKAAREFRHNWTTAARASGVPKDAREYIQGHSPDKASMNDRYGDREPLGEHIHKVKFEGLDLSLVLPWKTVAS